MRNIAHHYFVVVVPDQESRALTPRRRARQRTRYPAACNALSSRPPTYLVAPVNKISGSAIARATSHVRGVAPRFFEEALSKAERISADDG